MIEWLLDLENIRIARDAPLHLKWHAPLEAWVLFGITVLALGGIILIYRRETASRWGRLVTATLRLGLFALVLAVLCQPSLVLQRNRVEPSYVVLAVDSSQSMSTSDNYADPELAEAVSSGAGLNDRAETSAHTRLDLVRAALNHHEGQSIGALLAHNGIQLCTFSERVEPRGFVASISDKNDLSEMLDGISATGSVSDPARAIQEIVRKTQGRRLSAIVLATDGQATQRTNMKDALDLARDRHIPIYPLRIGSPQPPWDIAVGPLRSIDSVFQSDVLAIEAQIQASGLTEKTTITVELLDDASATVLNQETVELDPNTPSAIVELRTKPERAGVIRYRINVPFQPNELSDANNTQSVDIKVLNNRFSVLYVDGYPRYEYRFLKNALLRETTLDISVLLIDADEEFVQDGTHPIRRFPETPKELNRYDVVILGDVNPRGGWITKPQMNMLLDFVGNRGGGFGLVAGERFPLNRFMGTPLEKLIPIRIDATSDRTVGALSSAGFRPKLTTDGRRSRIFRFDADRKESEELFDSLPELYWFAQTQGPKPGATVLLEHPNAYTMDALGGSDPIAMPLVVTGKYGAGQLFFQATDDTWRWRRHTGEFLHDAYWVQVARELIPRSRVGQSRRAVIRTDRALYDYGTPARVQIQVLDSQLLAEQAQSIPVTIVEPLRTGTDPQKEDRPADNTPSVVGRLDVYRLGGDSNIFEGSWTPPRPGSYFAQALDLVAYASQRDVSAPFRVRAPDLEARRPEADHAMLERIASATNGRVLDLDELESGFSTIRDRSVQIPDDIAEPLWDSKLVLMLFVGMISMEWITRKVLGML